MIIQQKDATKLCGKDTKIASIFIPSQQKYVPSHQKKMTQIVKYESSEHNYLQSAFYRSRYQYIPTN